MINIDIYIYIFILIFLLSYCLYAYYISTWNVSKGNGKYERNWLWCYPAIPFSSYLSICISVVPKALTDVYITTGIIGTAASIRHDFKRSRRKGVKKYFDDLSAWCGCWFVVYIRMFIYTFLNVCHFDYTVVAGSGKFGPVNQLTKTSWDAAVTPTARPKSVRNRCVIVVALFVLSLCPLTFLLGLLL